MHETLAVSSSDLLARSAAATLPRIASISTSASATSCNRQRRPRSERFDAIVADDGGEVGLALISVTLYQIKTGEDLRLKDTEFAQYAKKRPEVAY